MRIVLDQPDYQIPLLLSGKTGMIVSPTAIAADPEALATKPVGAGQFVLDELVPDSHANLSKNPDFWNAEHIYLDGFVLKPTPDPAVAAAGLQTGQFDIVSLPASQVDAVESAGFPVLTFEVLPVRVLDVNDTVAPFDNPLVTQAISHAIDRQALIDVANFGYGKPLWQPFPDGYVAHSDELDDLYPYDPAKAEELLDRGRVPRRRRHPAGHRSTDPQRPARRAHPAAAERRRHPHRDRRADAGRQQLRHARARRSSSTSSTPGSRRCSRSRCCSASRA